MSEGALKRAISRSCTDAEYRALLLRDPKQALAQVGIDVPADVDVRVHECTEDQLYVVLPAPDGAALEDQGTRLPVGKVAEVPPGIELEWSGAQLVVRGQLDGSTAPALQRELERAYRDVDVVLSGVTFMSSAGVSALLAGQKHVEAQGCGVRLCDVPDPIRGLLEVVGVHDMFELGHTPPEPAGDDPWAHIHL